MADTLAAALWLAERGLHVFDIDHPELPQCAGVRTAAHDPAKCTDRGKHPCPVAGWSKEATTDRERVAAMFAGTTRNIGIACGPSGLLVVDEDAPDAFAKYAAGIGQQVPVTFTVTTGKGRHYYFTAAAGLELGNREGALKGHGVNIRGRGGYVVGPGSQHATGRAYAVENDAAVAPCPAWLVEALTARPVSARERTGGFAGLPEVIRGKRADVNGERHDVLMRYATSLLARDLPLGEAEVLMAAAWRRCEQPPVCETPMPWHEARALLDDVYGRYPAGRSEGHRHTDPTVLDETAVDPFDGAGEGLNDGMLCAEVAKNVMAGRYRWARGLGWLAWTGSYWKPTPDQAVHEETRRYLLAQWRRAVKRLEQAKSDEARKAAEQLVAAWRATLAKSRIVSITALAQGIAIVLTDPAALDAYPDLLNVGNGVVDLATGELRPHDPDLLLTKHTPVAYYPAARHPDWDAALAAIPGDVRDWLQLRYGQGVTGHMTPDDLLVVQDGGGENGKTTYAVAVRGALGDYYVAISHRALLGDPSQHPTELMSFRGARVALLEELPEERRLSVVRLKALIGTPTMKARLIRQDEVEFAASHTLFLNTNHLPVVDETDHGTWRRLARLRFPYVFRKPTEPVTAVHERRGDPNLRQRLQEGRHGQHEAVLAWLVAGAVTWYTADRVMPPLPPRILADTREWRGKSDLLLAYAAERLIFDLAAHVLAVELLADFNAWLTAHGHREWSDRTLAGRLEEHSEFIAHNVEKKPTRADENLSRRASTFTPPPEVYKAWRGLRFRQPHDSWPHDEAAGQDGSVTAVTASSDYRLENAIARVIPSIGYSGYSDPRDDGTATRPCGICGTTFDPDPPSRAVCPRCVPTIARTTKEATA